MQKNQNNELTIEDLEEDLNLEDFEDFEEEGSGEIDVSGIEYSVYPLYKENLTKLPDSLNPNKIVKLDKVYLYAPLNITSSYTPISGFQLNFDNIQNRFIVLRANGDFLKNGNKNLASNILNLKNNLRDFKETVNIIYNPKNDGKTNKPKRKNN